MAMNATFLGHVLLLGVKISDQKENLLSTSQKSVLTSIGADFLSSPQTNVSFAGINFHNFAIFCHRRKFIPIKWFLQGHLQQANLGQISAIPIDQILGNLKSPQISTDFSKSPQISANLHRFRQISTDFGKSLQISANLRGFRQISVDFSKSLQISANLRRFQQISADFGGSCQTSPNLGRIQQVLTKLNRILANLSRVLRRFAETC